MTNDEMLHWLAQGDINITEHGKETFEDESAFAQALERLIEMFNSGQIIFKSTI